MDTVTEELLVVVGAAMQHTEAEMIRAAEDLGLTSTQYKIVVALSRLPAEPTCSDLAACVGLSVAGVGRAVDHLVAGGIVARREDPHDRRVRRVELTAAGHKAMLPLLEARRPGVARLLEGLDEDERRELSAALVPVLAQLGSR